MVFNGVTPGALPAPVASAQMANTMIINKSAAMKACPRHKLIVFRVLAIVPS
jgi:hypothetical protein